MTLKIVLMGLALLICQVSFANDENADISIPNTEIKIDVKKIETPMLLKCFSNKRAFCYGLVSIAALLNAGLNAHSVYLNVTGRSTMNNTKTAIAIQTANSIILTFVAHLAIKEVSRCS